MRRIALIQEDGIGAELTRRTLGVPNRLRQQDGHAAVVEGCNAGTGDTHPIAADHGLAPVHPGVTR